MATKTIAPTKVALDSSLDPYAKYQWRKTDSGLWEREVDEAERFYSAFCRSAEDAEKAAFAITGGVSFSVPVSEIEHLSLVSGRVESALRSAWRRLHLECPGLNSWISYDHNSETWKRFHEALREDSMSFRVVETDSSEAEWFNTEPPVFKTPTLFLLRPRTPSVVNESYQTSIIFRSPHDVIDGHGVLQLLNRLFELGAEAYENPSSEPAPRCREDLQILPPPMRVGASISPEISDKQKQDFRATMAKNGTAALGLPPLGLPISAAKDTPSRKQRVSTTLSQPLTSQLLAKCKEQGFTVTHAISSAVVLALRNAQAPRDEPTDLRYYMQALISVRHMCQPLYRELAHSASNYHIIATAGMGVDITVGGDVDPEKTLVEDFNNISHRFRDYYVSARPSIAPDASRDDLDLAPLTWSLVTPRTAPDETPIGDSSTPAAMAISSLGNIPSMVKGDHNPFTLTNVWVGGEASGSSTPIMLGGWDGKIEISAIFDEAYHNTMYMKEFQKNVLKYAVRGLDLPVDGDIDSDIV